MIRQCPPIEFNLIWEIINDGAGAYKGVIPSDRWKEPYMPKEELQRQINEGVQFWGFEMEGKLVGVMGIQTKEDVTLIRHAYVRTASRNQGIGGKLLEFLRAKTELPILIGTWANAVWAVAFYEKHGFCLVEPELKKQLLLKYWSVPERQIETSVVLADERWFRQTGD